MTLTITYADLAMLVMNAVIWLIPVLAAATFLWRGRTPSGWRFLVPMAIAIGVWIFRALLLGIVIWAKYHPKPNDPESDLTYPVHALLIFSLPLLFMLLTRLRFINTQSTGSANEETTI